MLFHFFLIGARRVHCGGERRHGYGENRRGGVNRRPLGWITIGRGEPLAQRIDRATIHTGRNRRLTCHGARVGRLSSAIGTLGHWSERKVNSRVRHQFTFRFFSLSLVMEEYGQIHECGCEDTNGVRTRLCHWHTPKTHVVTEREKIEKLVCTLRPRNYLGGEDLPARRMRAPCGCAFDVGKTKFVRREQCERHMIEFASNKDHEYSYFPTATCVDCMHRFSCPITDGGQCVPQSEWWSPAGVVLCARHAA